LYTSLVAFSFVEAQTTYVTARITVTPGPGTGSVMGLGGLWFGSRRRRACGCAPSDAKKR